MGSPHKQNLRGDHCLNMSKDLFHIIYPVYKAGKFIGFLPFYIDGPTNFRCLKLSRTYLIIWNIFQFFIATIILWNIFRITPAFAGRTNVLILLAFLAAAISDCCYFTMDTFNKLIYRDDIMEIFNCLYRERENLRKLGLKLRHNLLKNCCFIYLIMHTTTVLWDLAACWVYMLKLDRAVDVIFGVSLSYMNLAQAISVSVYITMILTTQNMFRQINTVLVEKFLRNSPIKCVHHANNIKLLDSVIVCYENLTKTLRRINKAASSQILLLLALYFANITMQLLSVVQELIYYKFKDLYVILWGFLAVVCKDGLKLSVLLIVTDKCQKEVYSNLVPVR